MLTPDHQSMNQPEKFLRLVASGIAEWASGRPCPNPAQWQPVIAELLAAANERCNDDDGGRIHQGPQRD